MGTSNLKKDQSGLNRAYFDPTIEGYLKYELVVFLYCWWACQEKSHQYATTLSNYYHLASNESHVETYVGIQKCSTTLRGQIDKPILAYTSCYVKTSYVKHSF